MFATLCLLFEERIARLQTVEDTGLAAPARFGDQAMFEIELLDQPQQWDRLKKE